MARTKAVRDRAVIIEESIEGMKKWGIRLIIIAVSLLILGWIVSHTWVVLYPISIALIIATVLAPPVTWLRSKGWPSSLAALTVMLSFLAIIAGVIAILTPQVAGQVPELSDSAVNGLQKVRDWLTDGPLGFSDAQINNAISALQDKVRASATTIGSGVFSTIGTATSAVVNLVLIFMLTFFFIKDGHKFLPWAERMLGQRAGRHMSEVLGRSWQTLGGFIRTQALVALIDAILIGTGLAILGVPLAVPLAVLTFFGGFIPIIGAFVTGALAVLVTLVTNGPKEAIIALIIVVAVQQLEGNVLSPWLQGKNLDLHAGVVLLAVTAGGSLFGITGAFLAVPVAATFAGAFRYINDEIDASVSAAAPAQDSEGAEPPDEP